VLERLDLSRRDIALVVVDINRPLRAGIDWGSPLAQHDRLASLPHVVVYDPHGQVIAEGDEALRMALAWAQQSAGSP